MFTANQIRNQVKVIVVAALAKEFRKSQIIKRIIAIAKKEDHIATGALVRPDMSGAITPSRDDRWLIKPDAVQVFVSKGKTTINGISVRIKIEYGVEPQYFWLSNKSPNKKWWPNGYKIEEWIRLKAARGKTFRIKERGGERTMDPSNPSDVNRVAFVISRSLAKKGIRKTGLTDPFFGEHGVLKTVNRAVARYTARIYELFGTIIAQQQEQIFTNLLK